MKKGFTLIELLAVIVILAIIATIATPIVLSIIEDTKNSAILRSVEFYLDGVEMSISTATLKNNNISDGIYNILENGNICLEDYDENTKTCKDNDTNPNNNELVIEVKGTKPSNGTITIQDGKISDITINLSNKVVTKNEKGEFVIGSNTSDPNVTKTYKTVFANNTWDEIADACQKNAVPSTWEVGNTKTMTINDVEYNVTIIGKNHDTYADGSSVAPLTFQTDIVSEHVMNSTETTAGGWANSEMHAYLNNELINSLVFKDSIKTVVKSTNKGYIDSGNTTPTEAVTSNDKLFLLSIKEVFGASNAIYDMEGSQYDFYANGNSKIKSYDGSDTIWWLRTPVYQHGLFFNYVDTGGDMLEDSANFSFGVSFGFCF